MHNIELPTEKVNERDREEIKEEVRRKETQLSEGCDQNILAETLCIDAPIEEVTYPCNKVESKDFTNSTKNPEQDL